ncbi:MAG TPA: XdhC/CoxI family protein [Candidatus Methylomirabilis sp.]|nr:XdhC/CoxI family protein [Candidatus Methylomirabilis sp.]
MWYGVNGGNGSRNRRAEAGEGIDVAHESDRAPGDVAGDATALYARLAALLASGERLALCTILRVVGSGPRSAGARMLVRERGGSSGTVGGGLLEARATTWAQEVLRTGRALCRSFVLDLQQPTDEGMTCGGKAEVLVDFLDGTALAVRDLFTQVHAHLTRGEGGCLATAISRLGDDITTDHFLVAGGVSLASLSASGRSLPEDLLLAPASATPTLVERGTVRYFLDPLTPPITVYVFGGGHIAAHLVPLCHLLGFRTVVVDDRPDVVSRRRFPQATELVATPSFDHALESLPIGENGYVVIVTRGHAGDEAVLRQSLRRRPGYIGMIGSRRKSALIFEQLTREGLSPDDLARVACPIGLPIGAETPEEIAVSIAAQLVAVRAGRHGRA